MNKHAIGTIINYCSNEYRFFPYVVREALQFSKKVYVVIADHFFDGSLEKKNHLQYLFSKYPECQFIVYPYVDGWLASCEYKKIGPTHFWHSLSRLIGFLHVDASIEHLLFLDADEVVDSEKMRVWLDTGEYKKYDVMKLANYWYFRKPSYRALHFEDSVVFAKKDKITHKMLLHKEERDAMYALMQGEKKRHVLGDDNLPMVHHYSWVRTREEMLRKVKTWGHREDKDWAQLVEAEFLKITLERDFIHGYEYEQVNPFVNIDMTVKNRLPESDVKDTFQNISVLSIKDLYGILKIPPFFYFLKKVFLSRKTLDFN